MFSIRARVLLTMLVLLVSALATAQTTAQSGSTVTIDLVAKNIAFNVNSITVPAGSNVNINFDNQDIGVPHNFAVYTDSSATTTIFKGDIISGPKTTTYSFKAPTTPGTYFFRCDVHPSQMSGQFIVSAGAVSGAPTAPANVSITEQTNVTVVNQTSVNQTTPPRTPGFDGLFAVTGLMAAAYLVLGRKR